MADEKKKSRSERMYSESPKIMKDKEGKVSIGKAAKENSGTDGIQEHESHSPEMHVRHAKDRLVMHHKHEIDHAEMEAKHMKEKLSEMKGK